MIGDDCFGSARVFELDGLNALESVTIGTWSFTYARTDDDYGTKSKAYSLASALVVSTLFSLKSG